MELTFVLRAKSAEAKWLRRYKEHGLGLARLSYIIRIICSDVYNDENSSPHLLSAQYVPGIIFNLDQSFGIAAIVSNDS